MATKVNNRKAAAAVIRRPAKNPLKSPPRTKVTEELRTQICMEYYKNKTPYSEIARMYNISQVTVQRIMTKEKKRPTVSFEPANVLMRVDLDPLDRIKMLGSDGMQVIELAFAAMRYKLEAEINNSKSLENKAETLTAKQITDFVIATAPYVLPRADGGKPGNRAGETKNVKDRDNIRDMWKQQTLNKAANK